MQCTFAPFLSLCTSLFKCRYHTTAGALAFAIFSQQRRERWRMMKGGGLFGSEMDRSPASPIPSPSSFPEISFAGVVFAVEWKWRNLLSARCGARLLSPSESSLHFPHSAIARSSVHNMQSQEGSAPIIPSCVRFSRRARSRSGGRRRRWRGGRTAEAGASAEKEGGRGEEPPLTKLLGGAGEGREDRGGRAGCQTSSREKAARNARLR